MLDFMGWALVYLMLATCILGFTIMLAAMVAGVFRVLFGDLS